MKLRADNSGDSLWLLLDTMCNAFGGLILIAILLALVSNDERIEKTVERVKQVTTEMDNRHIDQTTKEIELAAQYNSVLKARMADPDMTKKAELVTSRDGLLAEEKNVAADLAKLIESQKVIQSASSQSADATLKALQEQIRKLDEDKSKKQASLRSALAELSDLRDRRDALESQSNTQRTKQVRKVRLPVEEKDSNDASKTVFHIILRYNHAYFTDDPTDADMSPNTFDISWTPIDQDRKLAVPIRDRGLDLAADEARVADLLQAIAPETFYVVCLVYNDSFGAFNQLKEQIVHRGLRYGWTPLVSDEPVIFTTREGKKPPPL